MDNFYINEAYISKKYLNSTYHIQYRGILDYCNFSCNYCPFSKKGYSKKKESLDKDCLFRLFLQLKKETAPFTFQIVPYGEALLFSYYWEFLAKLSLLPQVLAIGCQTNASFPIKKMLSLFLMYGGNITKLKLWCTFHPTMVSIDRFLSQIKTLKKYSLELCVGAVADPSQKESIAQLQTILPKDIYFWLNQMDGKRQPYTEKERIFFENIDPFFSLEESHFIANPQKCSSKNLFIEANGDLFACNISNIRLGNLYKTGLKNIRNNLYKNSQCIQKKCSRKECNCFLSYQNRFDLIPELALFSPYPAFRIIKKYQAAFFDIDNILLKKEKPEISERFIKILTTMSHYCHIYLITSLSYTLAIKKYSSIHSILSGGIFSEGAYIQSFDSNPFCDIQITNKAKSKTYGIQLICEKKGYHLSEIILIHGDTIEEK